MKASLNVRAATVSLLIFVAIVIVWYFATTTVTRDTGTAGMTADQIEYAKLMGKDAGSTKTTGFPTPMAIGRTVVAQLSDPFYDHGPNDKGIALQLAYSLGRVALGFGIAMVVAIPLGFLIGMSPLFRKALDPFIQAAWLGGS